MENFTRNRRLDWKLSEIHSRSGETSTNLKLQILWSSSISVAPMISTIGLEKNAIIRKKNVLVMISVRRNVLINVLLMMKIVWFLAKMTVKMLLLKKSSRYGHLTNTLYCWRTKPGTSSESTKMINVFKSVRKKPISIFQANFAQIHPLRSKSQKSRWTTFLGA